MSTQVAEGQDTSDLGPLLAALEPGGQAIPSTRDLFTGPSRLIVQAPDIRNDYKKSAGSSDGAKTYDTTAT
ncbi:MAG TPA: hypothetical protein VMU95_20440 [Trebonia sp.]|nr:hypothetical protein [Trebonia sp.]